jgi:hypothetical protein
MTREISDGAVSVVHFGDLVVADAMVAALRESGIPARSVPGQASRGDGASLALVVLLAIPVHAFLSALGESFGKSSADGLKALLAKVTRRNGQQDHEVIVIRDAVAGMDLELRADLPPEAFATLAELLDGGHRTLRYDADARRWVAGDKLPR